MKPISRNEKTGNKPTVRFHTVEDARRLARTRVPRMMFDFVDGAAGQELGVQKNRTAISDIRLQPRVLVDVADRSLKTRLLGRDLDLPFGIAPMGMCNLTWPDADGMLAAEAGRRNIPLCLSCAASSTLESVHDTTSGKAWFQLYVVNDSDSAMQMVARAEAIGYEVLVLTVDVPQVSRRVRDLKNGFQVPFKFGPKQVLDFACHPEWSLRTLIQGIPRAVNFETESRPGGFSRDASRAGATWDFLRQLRQRWKGQLVVKGVLSAEDAVQIRDAGADAIYVSNHGGRQLDSAPPAILALPLIRASVGPDYPLIFDSGVRSGEDVVKALALGADFVMLGRPVLYAIGADGARGLTTLFDMFASDIDVTLAQIGLRTVPEVDGRALFDIHSRQIHTIPDVSQSASVPHALQG